jgi:hypothetical protein
MENLLMDSIHGYYTPLRDLLQHLVKKNPNIAGKSRQIWDVKGK